MGRNVLGSRLTGAQLRGARGLLNITAQELAQASNVSLRTIRRAEQLDGPVQMNLPNAERIVAELEAMGIEFIESNGGGPGVRLNVELGKLKKVGPTSKQQPKRMR